MHQFDLLYTPLDTLYGNEYKYILARIDATSRFKVTRPLRTKQARDVAKMIVDIYKVLECYMDWFLSLICKNYIFKHFVKTVEPTSLNFCTIIELISLHLEYTITQVKYANFSYAHAQTFVLLNGEMATVSIGFRKLEFCLWLLRTVFYLN